MRKNGKNKKLALLVGMAMAFSAAYSVAPSDALAANYTVTVSEDKISVSEGGTPVTDATAKTVTDALAAEGNEFTISNAALKKLTPTGDGDADASIFAGNTITITSDTEGSNEKITYTAGEKAVLDTKGTLAGNYSSIDVVGDSSNATEVSLGDKATVDSFNVVSGKAELKSGTATTINVADGATLNVGSSGLAVDNLNVTGTGSLAGSSATITAKTITATGESVDLSGVTLSKGSEEGDTLTITNNSGGIKLSTVGDGVTVNASKVEATGKVTGGTIAADTVSITGAVTGGTVTATKELTVTGAVSGKATIDGGNGDVTLTGGIGTNSSADNAPNIKGNNITVGTALTGDSYATINAAGDVKFTGDNNATKNVTINASGTVDVGSTAMTNENMANIKANKLKTTGAVTVSSELTGIKNIETTGAFTASGTGALNFDSVTAGNFTNSATSGETNIKNLTVNGTYTNTAGGVVNVDSLKLGESAKFEASTGQDSRLQTINAKEIIVDSKVTASNLAGLSVNDGKGDVKLIIAKENGGALDAENADKDLLEKLAQAIYGAKDEAAINKVLANSTVVKQQDVSAAQTALENAQKAMKSEYNTYSAADIETKIAKADPFTTKLPSLADLQAMTSSDDQKNFADLIAAQKDYYDAQVLANTITSAQRDQLVAAMPKTAAEQAEKIRAAVQNAGKTAAAPAVTSMRTANVVADVATTNVVNRTAELRSFVPSAESEEKPDNLWFQYKHSKIDIDNGDTYSKSTVKTNSYQLGYDAKVSETDIVGGYVGTTTGSSEFNGPARSGSVDIKNALDLGLYGTHMMTKGQYIDYMLHRNKFDNRTMGQTYGTTDLGAMLRYGVKIAQPNGLTLDPYIQLAYDKISVDSYQAGENTISSDDSNNFSTKIGLNLITTGGLYGGLAYSRGLSGSYSAYVNGIAMPTQDNDTNVIYLNLGYRAGIARDIFLDLSLEKTFCDYDGWNAAGKINFYF